MVDFTGKSIIYIDDLSREEIDFLIRKTEALLEEYNRGEHHSDILKNRKQALLFYEPSTRTHMSFLTSIQELSGMNWDLNIPASSVKKNENLFFTALMTQANHADIIHMRHPLDGSAKWVDDILPIPIINGGDGKNEHPTQTLLDLAAIHHEFGKIDGLHISFGGDLKYGRTVHSLPYGLAKYDNVTLHLAAPKELMMPDELIKDLEQKGLKIIKHDKLKEALASANVHYQTRPQIERIEELPKEKVYEILQKWKITPGLLKEFPDIKVMHPLPIDSNVEEIAFEVSFIPQQYYLQQAHFGPLLRKAILLSILENFKTPAFDGKLTNIHTHIGKNLVHREFKHISVNERVQQHKEQNNGRYPPIAPLYDGIMIDHIDPGKANAIVDELKLNQRGFPIYVGENLGGRLKKSIIRIERGYLTQRDLKIIAKSSPHITVNEIKDGMITKKYHIVLCENQNCISNSVYEDVPPRFYIDAKPGKMKCHYCRSTQHLHSSFISNQDWIKFKDSLEKRGSTPEGVSEHTF